MPSLPRVPHNGDPRDLLSDKADAMVAYSTNEPFVLDQVGAPYQTFSPRAYGIDFYGDSLCTSAQQVRAHPERVRAFLAASLKGWQYALSHKEEIVDLILRRYSQQKSRDALLFEAIHTEALVQPDLIELGSQNAQHWKNIADIYRDLGMLSAGSEPEWRIFRTDDSGAPGWLKYTLLGLGALVIIAALIWLWVTVLGARVKAALGTPKLSVVMSVLFVCLSIPILIFILLYNYHTNSVAIVSTLQEEVAKTNQASIESTENLIQPVASMLRLLASAAAADPAFFRTEQSRDFLYQALTSAPADRCRLCKFRRRLPSRRHADRRRPQTLGSSDHADCELAFQLHRRLLGRQEPRSAPDFFRHLAPRRRSIRCRLDVGCKNPAGLPGRQRIRVARGHGAFDQSGYGLSYHLREIPDRA